MKHEGGGKVPEAGVNRADYSFAVNLMQFLVVPTFVLDSKGVVLIWNKACERLTGIPGAEVIGTQEHWQGFYDTHRPCLADLIVQGRMSEIDELYVSHDDLSSQNFGVHAETWCTMPRLGSRLYLAIDSGPIYDGEGKLLAVVETLRDITAHKNAQTELELLAHHDGLTGIFNRRGFDETLFSEMSRAIRHRLPLSLIMIDVDYFKRFNDTYGHLEGDKCLKSIATALAQAVLRPSDLVARYGAEEFAVILPSIDEEGARHITRRVQEAIAGMAIPHRGNPAGGGMVTVSMGVASLVPGPGVTCDDFIGWADRALYQAKGAGRNCAMLYHPVADA